MKEFYWTRDLSTAAFLLTAHSIHFEGLDANYDGSKSFLFSPKAKAEKLASDFIAGKALVNARLYSDVLRRAKTILFQAEREKKS